MSESRWDFWRPGPRCGYLAKPGSDAQDYLWGVREGQDGGLEVGLRIGFLAGWVGCSIVWSIFAA